MTKITFNMWYNHNKNDIDNLYNIWKQNSYGFLSINENHFNSNILYNHFVNFYMKILIKLNKYYI